MFTDLWQREAEPCASVQVLDAKFASGVNMPRFSKLSHFLLLSTLVAAVFSVGCGSGSSSGSGTRIRFVNAATNLPSMNVLIDGVTVTSNLANVGGTTAYLAVKSGARRIQIQDPNNLAFLIDTTPTISGDTTYIVRDRNVAGVLPPPLILADNNTAPTTGDFSVRAINLSPNSNAGADAYVVASTVSTLNGLTPTFSGLPYPPTTATYVSIAAGTGSWEAVFTPPGVTGPPSAFDGTPIPLTLVAGQIETLLLVEDAAQNKTIVPLVDVQ
jgi:hypothetical protein